jgi:hypothetical protein
MSSYWCMKQRDYSLFDGLRLRAHYTDIKINILVDVRSAANDDGADVTNRFIAGSNPGLGRSFVSEFFDTCTTKLA